MVGTYLSMQNSIRGVNVAKPLQFIVCKAERECMIQHVIIEQVLLKQVHHDISKMFQYTINEIYESLEKGWTPLRGQETLNLMI